ncbi:MAG TPA: hypothetical protein VFM70_04470 [Salinimicrobium sp.]|nr:hypothetical protein [Salinimicrobium sp.]
MIDKKAAEKLKNIIGKNYTSKLIEFARENGKLTQYKNKPTLQVLFSMVMTGRRDLPEVEDVILECAALYKEKSEAQSEKIKALI